MAKSACRDPMSRAFPTLPDVARLLTLTFECSRVARPIMERTMGWYSPASGPLATT
jgi:hypothetical protein